MSMEKNWVKESNDTACDTSRFFLSDNNLHREEHSMKQWRDEDLGPCQHIPAFFFLLPNLLWPSSLRMTQGQYMSKPHFWSHNPPWPVSLRMVLDYLFIAIATILIAIATILIWFSTTIEWCDICVFHVHSTGYQVSGLSRDVHMKVRGEVMKVQVCLFPFQVSGLEVEEELMVW